MSGLSIKSDEKRAKRRTKQAQNDACISFVLQGGVRPKVKVLHYVTFAHLETNQIIGNRRRRLLP